MSPARTPMRLIRLAALAAAALASSPPAASASGCAGAGAAPARAGYHELVHSTLCLLNAERRKRHLRKLRLSRRLSAAARRHSRDMVRRDYFSHTSPSGASFVDRIRRSGYLGGASGWLLGENLAWGAGSRATPAGTVRAWMHSPGHRRNILTARFRHVGIGIVPGAPGRVGGEPSATYTTDFAFRRR